MSEREQWLRAFHDARPGITSRALARAGSYRRLAAKVPEGRVLDLACGDGELLRLLGPRAVGVDLSCGELARARARRDARASVINASPSRFTSPSPSMSTTTTEATTTTTSDDLLLVQARAQELPFRDGCFDAATCHLAFMLFDDLERVVAELARVLRPGAPFIALLGGGPTADGHDAFHAFVDLMAMSKAAGPVSSWRGVGDRRASSEAGWRELLRGWSEPVFERWPLDLSGTFDEVWTFLSSSYQLRDDAARWIPEKLREAFPGERVPCTVVTFCATVTR